MLNTRTKYFNNKLNDYCNKITNESIQKLTEKYNLERNKIKILKFTNNDNNEVPNFNNFIKFLLFLSISSMTFYYYNRKVLKY